MKYNVVEMLEGRRLLAVTLDNGLAPTDPSYFVVTVGQGEPTAMTLGGTDYLTEYTAFLDLGAEESTLTESVVELSAYATDSVRQGNEAVSSFVITIADDDDATDPLFLNNPSITGQIRYTIPAGSTRLVATYGFTTSNFDLTTARFIQFWDGESLGGQDFLIVDGSVPQRDLRLRVADTQTVFFSEQTNGIGGSGSTLSGYGADDAAALRADIVAGGYNPGAFGLVNVPPANLVGFGDGFGPAPAIGTALVYTPLAAGAAVITTNLSLSPGVQGALMDVFYVSPTGAEVLVPDDTTVRSALIGTDFGTGVLPYPSTNFFLIENRGLQDLVLYGNPRVQLVGDVTDFKVTRQPTPVISGGGFSYFFIEFTPTTPGLREATVIISSSDPTTNPYTFKVYGGTGSGIAADIYENDGNSSDVRFRYFDRVVTPLIAKTVSVDGVWKVHTIHEPGDIDWSTFTLAEDTDVYMQTTSARGDMRMYLYDAAGNQLGYDNDSGVGKNGAMILHLKAGQYFLRVDEYGNNAQVPAYALAVLAKPGVQVTDMPVYLDGNGLLVIRGTEFADTISADIYDGTVRITLNTAQMYFPIGEVSRIFINGRGDNDVIYVGPGVHTADIRGAAGDDVITADTASDVTIIGGAGVDFLTGGGGNDFIAGKTGRDVIYGNDGNDYLIGSGANDMLYGGAGNDTLFGTNGDDMLDGGEGDDLFAGGEGSDWLYGGPGNDSLNGEGGTDVIDAAAGANLVTAQDGLSDTLYASPANDLLFYDVGLDVLVDITGILA